MALLLNLGNLLVPIWVWLACSACFFLPEMVSPAHQSPVYCFWEKTTFCSGERVPCPLFLMFRDIGKLNILYSLHFLVASCDFSVFTHSAVHSFVFALMFCSKYSHVLLNVLFLKVFWVWGFSLWNTVPIIKTF